MKQRRWLALLIALALVIGLLPAQALAIEFDVQVPETDGSIQIPFQVNPLYEGLIDEEDFPVSGKPGKIPGSIRPNATTYVTVEQAALQLRSAMESRTGTVTLSIRDSSSNHTEVLDRVLAAAVAHTGDPTQGDYLMWQFAGYSGEVYRDVYDSNYVFDFTLDISYYTTAAQERELDTAVNDLLNSLNLSGKSDYQKVSAVYDYICDNITYDYENLEDQSYTLKYTAYAALMDKTAVCQGYSLLLYRLLLELGVDTRLVAGETDYGVHAWNICKLGDVYYNLDSTWDAGADPYNYFLLNSDGFWDHYRYLDYMTTQFHTDYPMSATNYVDGVAGEPEYYYVMGVCGDDVYWAIDRDRNLTIAGNGAMYDFGTPGSSNEAIWVYWLDGFDNVIVEEGVTYLGTYAFSEMDNIRTVTLPTTLTTVGESAFSYCDGLTSVVIPDGVTDIGSYAFHICTNLRSVSLPSTVEYIDSYTFDSCWALTEITFSEGLQTIGGTAFQNCTSLTEITFPASLTRVNGFEGCTNLRKVTFEGNNIAIIDGHAFYGCTSLESFEIPASVKEIGVSAFQDCTALTEMTVPDTVTVFNSGFPGCTSLETVYLNYHGPINSYDYSDCTALKNVYISENITYIGMLAFQNCTALERIEIPGSVTALEYCAFNNCSNLKEIIFTGEAPQFDSDAFNTVTATAYYPGDLASWTDEVLQNYGGNITWVSTHTHSYEAVVTAPTCTAEGYTTYTCSGCGHSYVSDRVAPLSHDYANIVTAPTCTTEGYTTYTCSDCGHSYVSDRVAALGHDYADAEPVYNAEAHTHSTACAACGEIKTDNCTYECTETKAATLDQTGILTYTCTVCGGSYEAPSMYRIAGQTRVETAFAAANQLKEVLGVDTFDSIIITDGDNFADALTGSYLANVKGAPILLFRRNSTNIQLNLDYITENLTPGGTVYILGGESAVSAEMEAALAGFHVERIFGETRFATNLAILEEAGVTGGEILICTGYNFADSLAASATGLPILLVHEQWTALSDAQVDFLSELEDVSFTIVGGTIAVNEEVEADLKNYGEVDRLAGDTRVQTSILVAEKYFDDPEYALVAYGWDYPDGLCGGPVAYALGAPLLLSHKNHAATTASYIVQHDITKGAVLGGTTLLTEDVVREIFVLD